MKINELNAGVPLLQWDSAVAKRFIYQGWVRVRFEGGKEKRILNPIPISLVCVVIFALAIVVYSTVRAYVFLTRPFGLAFVVIVAVGLLVGLVQAFSFFTFGKALHE